jgi:two-component system response regulator GlrR
MPGFSPEAMQRLMLYEWPGNVRELANVVERAVVLATHGIVTPDLLLLGRKEAQSPRPELLSLKEAREEFERAYLVQVLTTAKGNVSRAAELAGRYRAEFYKLMRKHALDPGAFKDAKTTK